MQLCICPHGGFLHKEAPIQLTRFPARYAGVLMPFVLSILMTMAVSAVATAKNLGFGPEFLANWPSAWALSWVIAFPVLLIALPLTRRLVCLLVEPA
ncbi:Protein of unknown function (DUF2798) [Pannonibacter indicus]|uniref:DUF2798 domain-containing protein n=2 Tax=Pannonibacter indicus TaxID=466044 RepID=A0A0K6HMK1_9HYPH|nr:Protein of unknown function (DUF2798) [Pannonibacter indicus]